MSSRRGQQQYKTRTTFYLRISASAVRPYGPSLSSTSAIKLTVEQVLQMILYLDPTHTWWMNDLVLERVLDTLRERIRLKLVKESQAAKGKGTVDVYRGAGWQMAYYFRRTAQKHAVLLKDKQIVMEQAQPLQQQGVYDVDGDDVKPDEANLDRPIHGNNGTSGSSHNPLSLEEEDEDEKQLKPKLSVKYAGFAIFGRTLVVVVEPYPRLTEEQIRASSVVPAAEVRQLSTAPTTSRTTRSESLMAPPPAKRRRETETPLFRADTPSSTLGADDGDDEDMSGFRSRSQSIARTFGLDGDDEGSAIDVDATEDVQPSSRASSVIAKVEGAPDSFSMEQFLSPR